MISKWSISGSRPLAGALIVLLLASLCPPLGAPHVSAQGGTEVHIGIRSGANTRLALRLDNWVPSGDIASATSAGQRGLEVLRNDLTINGQFTLSGGDAPGDSAAASLLPERAELHVEVRATGLQYEIRAQLYGLPGRSLITQRTYETGDSQLRHSVHQLADDVVFQLTGETGIAQSQIAYALQNSAGREIYVADYDGDGAHAVTHDRNLDFSPAFSPDGRTIVYSSFRGHGFVLAATDLSTGKDRVLVNLPGSSLSPAFSPDGQLVAFASSKTGDHEIYTVTKDGAGLRQLTHSPGIDVQPSWSPDGRQLAFCSDRLGSAQIFLMDSEGGNVRRVTHDATRNEAPSFCPKSASGALIAFMARQGNQYDVCVADAASNTVYNLTQGKGGNESPHWAANGRHLLILSTRASPTSLYILNSDNGETFRLPIQGNVETPAWYR